MALTTSVPEVFAIFRKKIFFAFFSSLFKYFFSLFFRNLFYFSLGLVPNISLKFTIFFYLLQHFVKFIRGDISVLHCLWNDIGYAFGYDGYDIDLLWANSLITSCFSCFTVKNLKYFCVMAVARERSRLVPLKAIPTGNPTPLANAAIEIPPVITVDVIRSFLQYLWLYWIVSFFWQFVHALRFH